MTMYTKYLYIRIFLYTMLDSMSDCYRSILIEIHRICVEQICIYICFIYFPSIEYWNWSVKIVYRFSQRGDTFNELYYENGGFYSTYILIILINYRVVFFVDMVLYVTAEALSEIHFSRANSIWNMWRQLRAVCFQTLDF